MKQLTFLTLSLVSQLAVAQKYDTLFYRPLTVYSETTINNLNADTEHWTQGIKSNKLIRYVNAVATEGGELTANGVVISETSGIYVKAGIAKGCLLLCHNNGSKNGLQVQNGGSFTLKGLKAGQYVSLEISSSDSGNNGIASVTNLEGEVGENTYVGPNFKNYTFRVKEDGDVSWSDSGNKGVIYRNILVYEDVAVYNGTVETPTISCSDTYEVTLSTATEGATILYTLVDHGTIQDYPSTYSEPFTLTHKARLRAQAFKENMVASEVVEQYIDVPLSLPYAGRPYIQNPEPLDRGVIATATTSGYLVNWRRLIDDSHAMTFRLLRDGVQVTTDGYTLTNLLDKNGNANSLYELQTLIAGEVMSTDTAMMLTKGYWDIPLDVPADSTTESGQFMYVPGDCMVADVDGDLKYEVVMKWDPCDKTWNGTNPAMVNDAGGAGQKDNSLSGFTGNVLIDCYEINPNDNLNPEGDAKRSLSNPNKYKWRIDLGRNIRAGAHYTQLMVYDLDGDGRAEVACKTAPGTIDGKGHYVLLGNDDPTADYRSRESSKAGSIISGPEYLTVFDGENGEAIATTHFLPPRDTISNWGDSYGNRSERYLGCVAYLGNERQSAAGIQQLPSLVMCRGYYTASFLWAVDLVADTEHEGKVLKTRWLHSSTQAGYGAYGEGAHGISVADVDGDMRDEIIYGSCAIDHDGTLLYRTGLGHGDALHVGDLCPDRPGLEVMMVHEETSAKYGVEMHDALTGENIFGINAGSDVGRGMCADIDASSRGCESWSTLSSDVYDVTGKSISTKRPTVNFRTYWDGDLQEELTEKGVITKWTGRTSSIKTLVDFKSVYGAGVNLIKYTPCLQADIFGDWREEQIYYDNATRAHLWIFSTPYQSEYAIPTLMHDHQYRMATVWQTSAYNQPPHLSFFLPDYVKALQEETAIEKVATEPNHAARLLLMNGKLQIVKGASCFDLQGRPVHM